MNAHDACLMSELFTMNRIVVAYGWKLVAFVVKSSAVMALDIVSLLASDAFN